MAKTMHSRTPPEGYRHCTPVTIRFGDIDAMGHVNNAKYLTYMESGRITYFRDLGLWDGFPRLIGPIMAKVTVDYRLPLGLEDGTVDVFTRCARLGNKSYDMEHLIVRYQGDQAQIAAYGLVVLVAYDYQAAQSVALPERWRDTISTYEVVLAK